MATSVGEIEATLALKDEMTAELRRIQAAVATTAADIAVAFEAAETGVAHYLVSLKELSGIDVVSKANAYAESLKAIGGAAALTATEQKHVNAVVTEAIAKYEALGTQAPQALRDLAAATAVVTRPMSDLDAHLKQVQAHIQAFSGDKVIQEATQLARAVQAVGGASKLTAAEQKQVNAVLTEAIEKYRLLGREAPESLKQLAAATAAVRSPTEQLKDFAGSLQNIGGVAQTAGTALTIGLTAPIAAIGVGAFKAASQFESSFAGVRKTVDASKAEFSAMEQQFRDLAKTIPVSVNELARLGEAAGALGIPQKQIVDFSRTMAELGLTTNVTSDQAAESIAQIQTVFGAAGVDTRKFADTLVDLGNKGASTERNILALANRIGSAGSAIGLSQAQVLGYAAAIANVGIEAEAGGSAISKVFAEISIAVSHGGDAVKAFADVAEKSGKVTANAFAAMFKTDAAGAVQAFIEGLGKMKREGADLNLVLEDLGFKEIRQAKTLRDLALSSGNLSKALDTAKTAWKEGGALAKEAGERYKTTESQLALFGNKVVDVGIELGNALLPMMKGLLAVASDLIPYLASAAKWFGELPRPIQMVVVGVTGLVAALGPLLFVLGGLAQGVGSIVTLLVTLGPGFTTAGVAAKTAAIGVGAFTTALALIVVPLALERIMAFYHELNGLMDDNAKHRQEMATVEASEARMLAEASRVAGRSITDLGEGYRVLREKAEDAFLAVKGTTVQLSSLGGVAIEVGKTAGAGLSPLGTELARAREAVAKLDPAIRQDLVEALKSGAFNLDKLRQNSGLSEVAFNLLRKEVMETTKEVTKHGAAMKKMLAEVSGSKALDAAKDLFAALEDGVKVDQLSVKAKKAVNEVMRDAMDVYVQMGRQVPRNIIDTINATAKTLDQGKATDVLTDAWRDSIDAMNKRKLALGNMALADKENIEQTKAWIEVWTSGIPVVERMGAQWVKLHGQMQVSNLAQELKGLGEQVQVDTTLIDRWDAEWEDHLRVLDATAAGIALIGDTLEGLDPKVAGALRSFGSLVGQFANLQGMIQKFKDANIKAGGSGKLSTGQVFQSTIASLSIVIGGVQTLKGLFEHFGVGGMSDAERAVEAMQGQAITAAGSVHALGLEFEMAGVNFDAFLRAKGPEEAARILARAQQKAEQLNAALEMTGLSWRDLGQKVRQANVDQATRDIVGAFELLKARGADATKAIKGMSGSLSQLVIDAVKTGTKIPAALAPILKQLILMGDLSEDAARALLGIADDGVPALADIKEAAERYGLTLDQLGSKVKQIEINELATQIVKDFKTLSAAGVDTGTIMNAMKDKVQDLVTNALKLGLTLPESLRPLIQSMVDAGLLTDEFGDKLTDTSRLEFAKPLAERFDELIAKLDDLIDAFNRAGDSAVENFGRARGAAEELGKAIPRGSVVTPPPGQTTPAPGSAVPRPGDTNSTGGDNTVSDASTFGAEFFDRGGIAGKVVQFRRRGRDRVPAELTPGEEILSPTDKASVIDAFDRLRLAEGQANEAGSTTVILELDGRAVAELVVPHIPGAVKRYKLA